MHLPAALSAFVRKCQSESSVWQYYDLAADVLAENAHLTYKYLSQYLYDYLDAILTQQTSPQEAFRKFDAMAQAQTETLRKLTKKVPGPCTKYWQSRAPSKDDSAVGLLPLNNWQKPGTALPNKNPLKPSG